MGQAVCGQWDSMVLIGKTEERTTVTQTLNNSRRSTGSFWKAEVTYRSD